jgi:dephospho-CoA kinase
VAATFLGGSRSKLGKTMSIHLFGLTGGIGSGKSTVAARFRERGLPVIDADELAREVVAKGSPGLGEIVAFLGPEVLDAEGGLDRKRVAAIVFNDADARRRLNAITHPRVAALAVERSQAFEATGEPLACYEVPLLVEAGLAAILRPLVVVTADVGTQLARAMARDSASEAEISARIAAQMPLEKKAELADFVIENSGSIEATRSRADEVLDAICEQRGIDPSRYPR